MPGRSTSSNQVPARGAVEDTPVRFLDFAIRAWREGPFAQVIAHSTPAGAMRQPTTVRLGRFVRDDYVIPVDAPLARGAEVGRELARLLMPAEIWRLLAESLAAIGPRHDVGLRIRLCLDEDLIDLPWEFLYRPDVKAPAAQSGFLLTEGRISLTREPPSLVGRLTPSDRTQRGLFMGTMWDDGSDGWAVKSEFASLQTAMRPVDRLMEFTFVTADDIRAAEAALSAGCDVFHYAGHVEVADNRGRLLHRLRSATLQTFDTAVAYGGTPGNDLSDAAEAYPEPAPWSRSDVLATRLVRARTRLAVFNACNSGLWPFVRPFMRAGVPAVVGVQGLVSNIASLHFAEKLYQTLAVGLSLDEAMTYARSYVMQHSFYPCDWGRFMAYLPTETAVLFPRPQAEAITERQRHVRVKRAEALDALPIVAKALDGEGVSRMLSEVASRSVLILGRFTAARKRVLDLIRTELSTQPRQYVPILFDFDRPSDRTMIESVLRFAAVSRFVIADLSDPKWVLAELQQIVPSFRSLPVVPIIERTQHEDEVIGHFEGYASVHRVVRYDDAAHLQMILDAEILGPAEALYDELKPRTIIS